MKADSLSGVHSGAMSNRRIVNAGAPPAGPYSHAVVADGLIYLAGVLAEDGHRQVVAKGDAAAQTTAVIERLRERLVAAGSSLDHVVSVMVYLKSAADIAAMNGAFKTFWSG